VHQSVKEAPATQLGQGLQRQELKAFDTALSFAFDATGEVPATGQLCFVQTGDTLNNRDGASSWLRVSQFGLVGYTNQWPQQRLQEPFYLYVVLDKQANGAAAGVTDVLTSTDLSIALGNVPNQYRFRILRKIAIDLSSQAGVTDALQQCEWSH